MPHARLNDPQPNDHPHNRATPQIQYGTQLRGPHDDADKDRWVGPAWNRIGDRQNASRASGIGGAPDLAVKVGVRKLPLQRPRRRSHSGGSLAK